MFCSTAHGDREGTTVIQLYAADVSVDRPVAQLLGFQKVTVPAGAVVYSDPVNLTAASMAANYS